MNRPATAYKLAAVEEWTAALSTGRYAGSEVDHRDGFIHLSDAEQLAETARRHFAGRRDLVLLTVDLGALGDAVRWEPSRRGALFPHIHGVLPVEAVTGERRLSVSETGEMLFEPAS